MIATPTKWRRLSGYSGLSDVEKITPNCDLSQTALAGLRTGGPILVTSPSAVLGESMFTVFPAFTGCQICHQPIRDVIGNETVMAHT